MRIRTRLFLMCVFLATPTLAQAHQSALQAQSAIGQESRVQWGARGQFGFGAESPFYLRAGYNTAQTRFLKELVRQNALTVGAGVDRLNWALRANLRKLSHPLQTSKIQAFSLQYEFGWTRWDLLREFFTPPEPLAPGEAELGEAELLAHAESRLQDLRNTYWTVHRSRLHFESLDLIGQRGSLGFRRIGLSHRWQVRPRISIQPGIFYSLLKRDPSAPFLLRGSELPMLMLITDPNSGEPLWIGGLPLMTAIVRGEFALNQETALHTIAAFSTLDHDSDGGWSLRLEFLRSLDSKGRWKVLPMFETSFFFNRMWTQVGVSLRKEFGGPYLP